MLDTLNDHDREEGNDPLDADPNEHVIKSTFGIQIGLQPSVHSKLGWRERVKMRKEDRMSKANNKFEEAILNSITMREDAGLFCCDAKHEESQTRCTAEFFLQSELERHKAKGDHTFPSHSLLTDISIKLQSGYYASSFALGQMSNRDAVIAGEYEIKESNEELKSNDYINEMGLNDTHSIAGAFNRNTDAWKKPPFSASDALLFDIEMMFMEGERRNGEGKKKNAAKYTAEEAVARLSNMKNIDGSRKYSYRENNTNGPLPTVAYVKQKFSNRKNSGAALFSKPESDDLYSSMSLPELKKHFLETIDGDRDILRAVLSQMLEADDEVRYGSSEDIYIVAMSTDDLKIQCRNRSLPTEVNEDALRIILRANKKAKDLAAMKEVGSDGFEESIIATEREEAIVSSGALRFKDKTDEFAVLSQADLKEKVRVMYKVTSDEYMTNSYIQTKLLELDSVCRMGHIEMDFAKCSREELQELTQTRHLPSPSTKTALQILLRGVEFL